jgi:hypothetical protein
MMDSSEEPMELPESLQSAEFEERIFPGMDALVAIVPKGGDVPGEVKQTVDDAGAGRWFPFEGGWKVVCPYTGQDFNSDRFTVEKGGWEHEHCDGCQGTIGVGDHCWVAETEDECYVICDNCHKMLRTRSGDTNRP